MFAKIGRIRRKLVELGKSSLTRGGCVRYETDGGQARYRLKHSGETQQLLEALAKFIDTTSAFQR